ncbi:MAG: response regulator [Pseudomonadota bacterium]
MNSEKFDITKSKILVVDDFGQMRSTCKRMLADYKAYDVDDTGSGEDAIEKMRIKKYDIILCDYNLGEGQDGQQVLEEARNEGILDIASVFIMLTAENTSGMVLGAVEYEPDDYITKPFTKEVLRLRLQRVMERKAGLSKVALAIKNKDYNAAINYCNQLIVENPKNALFLMKTKANIHFDLAEYDMAEQIYQKVLEKYPVAWAKLGWGKIRFLQQDYFAAKTIFTELIGEFPNQIEGYDWLAKTHEALGELTNAQAILQQASSKSPKVLVRRQNLGDIALKNNDLETAELSFKAAVKLSTGSSYRRAEDFTKLAQIFIEQKKDQKALQFVKQGRDVFRNAPKDLLHLTVTEGNIHHSFNRPRDAGECIARAAKIYTQHTEALPSDSHLEFAEGCLIYGDKQKGVELMKEMISNNHDDENFLNKVRSTFTKASMAAEGEELVKNAVKMIIDINNEGARLANAGKFEEAITLFGNAARKLPKNKIINLNAAQALIIYMEKNSPEKAKLSACQHHLETVKQIDPKDKRYRNLLKSFEKLTEKLAAKG